MIISHNLKYVYAKSIIMPYNSYHKTYKLNYRLCAIDIEIIKKLIDNNTLSPYHEKIFADSICLYYKNPITIKQSGNNYILVNEDDVCRLAAAKDEKTIIPVIIV